MNAYSTILFIMTTVKITHIAAQTKHLHTKMYSIIRRNEILIIRRDKDELISHDCVHDTSE